LPTEGRSVNSDRRLSIKFRSKSTEKGKATGNGESVEVCYITKTKKSLSLNDQGMSVEAHGFEPRTLPAFISRDALSQLSYATLLKQKSLSLNDQGMSVEAHGFEPRTLPAFISRDALNQLSYFPINVSILFLLFHPLSCNSR
jgi:hypothetical protein